VFDRTMSACFCSHVTAVLAFEVYGLYVTIVRYCQSFRHCELFI